MKKLLSAILSIVLLILAVPNIAMAQEQQGAVPYVLNPERETDNLEMLTAASAERPDEITIFNAGVPKYFWINNFGERETDYLTWKVKSDLSETETYYAWLHLNAQAGTEFKIEVKQGDFASTCTYTKANNGWEVTEFGTIDIPSGESTITLTKTSLGAQTCSIKGLDMIRNADKDAYEQRVAAYKQSGAGTRERFSSQDYGLFLQYGVWGYPQEGPKKSMEESTNDFDVDDFVALVKKVDAKFVIWSITWWEYKMQMPVKAVDAIMGNSEYTTERNLIGEIARKCKEEGIDFYLYYHQGIQQEPEWKEKQNWPDNEFTQYGTGDRSTFFENWKAVISEIGNALGSDLDGWFFDDGCVYYPAPFESLAKAAKAGNSERLISFNAWQGTRITEFQDMIFGEGTWGEAADTTDGIFNSGKEEGLQQVGMPMLNNSNWGITSQNETIELIVSQDQIINGVKSAHERKVPLALNIKMWEDGTIGDSTYEALIYLKDVMQGNEQQRVQWINDTEEGIRYSEGDWEYGGTIYNGYYNNDCHYAKDLSQNPGIEYTFTGTGIGIVSDQAGWAANCDVYIDGQKAGTAEFNNASEIFQTEGFVKRDLEYGEHTVRLEFLSDKGSEAQLDAFKVYNEQGDITEDPVTKVQISAASASMPPTGELQLKAVVKPQYATNKEIEWSVSDENGNPTYLAEIDENGLLRGTGKGYGTVLVTAASKENPEIKDTMTISIEKMPERETVYGNDKRFVLSGDWTTSDSSKSIYSIEEKATAELTFEGNYVEWYGVKGSDHGRASIYIDDKYVTNIDCYSTDREVDTLLFRSEDLGPGKHTIKIEVDSLKNDYATNRYVEVYRIVSEKSPVDIQISEVVASIPSGTYKSPVTVELATETDGAEIYYTTDGSDPDAAGTKYENPLEIKKTTTVKAIAVKEGMTDSDISTYTYEIVPDEGSGDGSHEPDGKPNENPDTKPDESLNKNPGYNSEDKPTADPGNTSDKAPQTGDNTNVNVWVTAGSVSLLIILSVLAAKKFRRSNK